MSNLKISSIELREKAYLVFVRPLLEFSVGSLHQLTKRNIGKNRYHIHNTSNVSAMLDRLDWPTLQVQQRRKSARLAMLWNWKINNNMVQWPYWSDPEQTAATLISKQCRTQYRQFSFLPRFSKEWNELPSEAVGPAFSTPLCQLNSQLA